MMSDNLPIMPIYCVNEKRSEITIGMEHIGSGERICLDKETFRGDNGSPISLEDIREFNRKYLQILTEHNVI